ncbi:MAG: hscB [Sphingobacteriaceae bacterium]|jgi:molecular chaperone HscB|nr:hscB [Sphingobacteriaceae bacterium]
MNYFEFYNIPEAFNVDELAVKRKFYELSKQYHPDFYINESADKQQQILELSTINNKAYQVLSDDGRRLKYMLELNGLITEDEKYKLPQSFLMEMMDVNEALMELEFDAVEAGIQKISLEVDEIEKTLSKELKSLSQAFDKAEQEERNSILLKIKDLWYRQKYLLRIRDSLNKFATR